MTKLVALVIVPAALTLGCSQKENPTAPSPTSVATEVFNGTLDVLGSSFYSFTVAEAGNVSILLASVASIGRGPAVTVPVSIGVGIPHGTGCDVVASLETAAALVSQFTPSVQAGIHCVEVRDTGHLSSAVSFSIRIVHP